ncbi:hypothetical protein FA15DRAFT_661282 [Coprinopsis marcescibilis]|uniref:Uncharacterized protein n=1 Tax=Coprinopsis marcescibilis TaxID=230819 RepID=A0A5C3KCF8_COPMA|nr:hypothetical protein FA15DRAFT_661282 [Coprinopsis marcescibilis]
MHHSLKGTLKVIREDWSEHRLVDDWSFRHWKRWCRNAAAVNPRLRSNVRPEAQSAKENDVTYPPFWKFSSQQRLRKPSPGSKESQSGTTNPGTNGTSVAHPGISLGAWATIHLHRFEIVLELGQTGILLGSLVVRHEDEDHEWVLCQSGDRKLQTHPGVVKLLGTMPML